MSLVVIFLRGLISQATYGLETVPLWDELLQKPHIIFSFSD